MSVEEIEAWYEAERPMLDAVGIAAKRLLADACGRRHISCEVTARTKTLPSVVKKLLYPGPGSDHTYESLLDKVGLRVVLHFSDQMAKLREAIESVFTIEDVKDKASGLAGMEFGYAGIHFAVRLKEGITDIDEAATDLRFELQVHTHAQNLFAAACHQSVYKPMVDNVEVTRAFGRIAAVLELVDLEVLRVRDLLDADSVAAVRRTRDLLETAFIPLASCEYSRDLTLRVLEDMCWMTFTDDFESWSLGFHKFVRANEEELGRIYEKYGADLRNPLMSQPESLLILYAQSTDAYTLEEKWPEWIGKSVLLSFQGIWPSE